MPPKPLFWFSRVNSMAEPQLLEVAILLHAAVQRQHNVVVMHKHHTTNAFIDANFGHTTLRLFVCVCLSHLYRSSKLLHGSEASHPDDP